MLMQEFLDRVRSEAHPSRSRVSSALPDLRQNQSMLRASLVFVVFLFLLHPLGIGAMGRGVDDAKSEVVRQ
jgi:hypothetical protein